jgi:hypothetical protein
MSNTALKDMTAGVLDQLNERLLCDRFLRQGPRRWTRGLGQVVEQQVRVDTLLRAGSLELTAFAGLVLPSLETEFSRILASQSKSRDSWTIVAEVGTLLTGRFTRWQIDSYPDAEKVVVDLQSSICRALSDAVPDLIDERSFFDFLSSDSAKARLLAPDRTKRLGRCVLLAYRVFGAESDEFQSSIAKLEDTDDLKQLLISALLAEKP